MVTRRRSGAKITYLRQPRLGEAITDELDSTRLATGPLARLLEIPGHRRGRRRAQRQTTDHARSRNPVINDGANLTVNTTVRSGTITPSGRANASFTYRRP